MEAMSNIQSDPDVKVYGRLWQTKLDKYIRSRLFDPANPNRSRWVERDPEYVQTHTVGITEVLIGQFRSLKGLRIIDLGCGSGLDAINLAKAGALVTGVDSVSELIEIAQLRASDERVHVKFVTLEQRSDWYLPEYYDVAIAIDVLEHIEEPGKLIEDCRALLRQGGLVILTTPNRWALGNIRADPHWHMFGVTLLPRRLAETYVVRFRRVLRYYDMTNFVGLPTLRSILRQKAFLQIEDNVTAVAAKLLAPSNVIETRKQWLIKAASGIAKVDVLRALIVWCYCYAFVGTWRIVAKKPSSPA